MNGRAPGRGRTAGRIDALVTDAQSRAAVAGVRALGRAGLRVLALGADRGAPALWSRHATRRALGPRSTGDGFVERIAELADELGPFVVHPGQEEALTPLAGRAGVLPDGAVPAFSTPGAVLTLRDKRQLPVLAERAGLRTPATLAAGPAGEVLSDPSVGACVVKSPGLSAALPLVQLVDDQAELEATLAALPPGEPVVLQERLDPALHAISVVVDPTGRLVGRFQQASRRTWPVRAGASSFAVSVPPDAETVSVVVRLLAGTGFSGLAQVQFLLGRDGPAVIDVNPRFYGSLPLALAAGVNLPAIAQAAALGHALPDPPPYRVGTSYRWLEGDVLAALKGSRAHLRPGGSRPRAGAMWASDDPVPACLLAAHAVWTPLSVPLRRSSG